MGWTACVWTLHHCLRKFYAMRTSFLTVETCPSGGSTGSSEDTVMGLLLCKTLYSHFGTLTFMFIARCWTRSVMIGVQSWQTILFVGGAGRVSVYCTFQIIIHFRSDLIIVGKHSSSFKYWWTRSYLLLLWAVSSRGRHSDSSSNLVLCILFSYNWLQIHPQISSSCGAPTWQSHSFLLLMIHYHFITLSYTHCIYSCCSDVFTCIHFWNFLHTWNFNLFQSA